MILPTKHIETSKSLLAIGAQILGSLPRPRTVTSIWDEVRNRQQVVSFETFSLALTFLYTIGTVDISDDLVRSAHR